MLGWSVESRELGCRGVRSMISGQRLASAGLFGQGDDDAGGAAQVAQQEDVLVLRDLAEEFGAVGAQAGDGVLDVVDGEHDAKPGCRRAGRP
jgi:hypothetical protein